MYSHPATNIFGFHFMKMQYQIHKGIHLTSGKYRIQSHCKWFCECSFSSHIQCSILVCPFLQIITCSSLFYWNGNIHFKLFERVALELTSQIIMAVSNHDFPYLCYHGNKCRRYIDSAKVGLKWMIPLEKIYPLGLDLIWQILNNSVCGVKSQLF